MNTTFSQKDLVSFGNYIGSLIAQGMKLPEPNGTFTVTHADFENWKVGVDIRERSIVYIGVLDDSALINIRESLEPIEGKTPDETDLYYCVVNELRSRV